VHFRAIAVPGDNSTQMGRSHAHAPLKALRAPITEAIPILSTCFPGFGPLAFSQGSEVGVSANEVTTRYKEES